MGVANCRWLALAALAACSGSVSIEGGPDRPGAGGSHGDGILDPRTGKPFAGSGAGASSGSGAGGSGAVDPVAEACTTLDVGFTPLRRLTRGEYNQSVADLLGDSSAPADQFVPDEKLLGFSAGLTVPSLLAEQYMSAAEALSAQATEDLPALLECDPAAEGEDTCAHAFIDSFGRRLHRRPLADDERTDLRALYAQAKTAYDFRTGIELTLQAMLQSPDFLYRVELGSPTDNPDLVQLSGYEIAARLSYLMWGTTPSAELLEAAEAGDLDDVAGIAAQARALLDDPRSHQTVRSFHDQWLNLEALVDAGKDPEVYPAFDDGLKSAMREETLRFVDHVVFEEDGAVEKLFTSPFSFINDDLATLYGMTAQPGAELARVDLDTSERLGILTHASVLSVHAKANQSSPVHRGKFVRERIFCQQLMPPPADLVITPPDPSPDATTRERFKQHSEDQFCAGCHALMDPIGFGFEHYDGIGRFRSMDGDFPVDASGEVTATRDANGTFDGIIELTARLSQSVEVNECVATNWFVYAFGRSITNEMDDCSRERLYKEFADSGYRIPELLIALTGTDAFRYRRTTGAE